MVYALAAILFARFTLNKNTLRIMRKLFAIILSAICLNGFAQEQTPTVNIWVGGQYYEVENVDSITFGKVEKPDPTKNIVAVDMGFGVKWADRNIGAQNPEDYGGYYSWGETDTKETYRWSNYKYGTGSSNISKYNESDNLVTLDASDDAASVATNGVYRTPTADEMQQLIDSCTWEWTTENGVEGYKVTAQNGNSIFLPAAGRYFGTKTSYTGRNGYYWSSSLYIMSTADYSYASSLFINSTSHSVDAGNRFVGYTIRPVLVEETPDEPTKVDSLVDLGLSVKWASFNLGAAKPEDQGNFYAWGETEPKDSYSWETYKYGNESPITKYNSTDNLTVLDASDDAATVTLGEGWRMPIFTEMKELHDNCTWTWTTQNDVAGYVVKASNGNSIFLPAAGKMDGELNYDKNQYGYYWTSSLVDGYIYDANGLYLYSDDHDFSEYDRYIGYSIRPVHP